MTDVTETLNQIQHAFSELKSANEQNLADRDVVLEGKIAAINSAITDLERKAARPNIAATDQASDEHKTAFDKWARKGIEGDLASIEVKAITTTGGTPEGANGGFALPKVVETGLYAAQETLSPIRQLATVVQVSGDDYRILTNLHGLDAGWVGETDARPETDTPTLSETRVPMGEIYANPAVSQRALDDLAFNVDQFIIDETSRAFAIKENAAFVSGDGVNKPMGILSTTGINTVKTGSASALAANADGLLSMIYGIKAPYRQNAVFAANSTVIAAHRTLKDTTGNYLWQPSLIAGAPATLNGYGLVEMDEMPGVAANAQVMLFGDFRQGYLIADRITIRTLRDPYSKKPFVLFYSTKRVGGMVRDKNAFSILKVAA